MAKESVKKLPVWQRVGGLILIVLFMIGGIGLGMWSSGMFDASSQPEMPNEESSRAGAVAVIIILFVVGLVGLGGGAAAYGITLGSRCFTSDFSKPFLDKMKGKLFPMNMLVILLLALGAAGFVSMVVTPIMLALGMSVGASVGVPFLGALVVTQLVMVWVNIWQPLEKSTIRARLKARGLAESHFEKGIYVGLSDPANKSSKKKKGMVEEDMGMLWISEKEIVYAGDKQDFGISREQLIDMERAADAGSTSAYFGNVHVILRFRTKEGVEVRRRLHTEGIWTMSGKAKASDMLAERILAWRERLESRK